MEKVYIYVYIYEKVYIYVYIGVRGGRSPTRTGVSFWLVCPRRARAACGAACNGGGSGRRVPPGDGWAVPKHEKSLQNVKNLKT